VLLEPQPSLIADLPDSPWGALFEQPDLNQVFSGKASSVVPQLLVFGNEVMITFAEMRIRFYSLQHLSSSSGATHVYQGTKDGVIKVLLGSWQWIPLCCVNGPCEAKGSSATDDRSGGRS